MVQRVMDALSFALVFGYAFGGFGSAIGALISGTFDSSNIGMIFSLLDIGFAIGGDIEPILGGYVFDISNSYSPAFLSSSLAMVVATLLIVFVRSEINSSISDNN